MSTPTDVEVQLSPEGDPLGIIWQRPDYRAAELTSLTTKLLERVADDVATRVREEMRRVLADSVTFGHHPRDTARALQEAYGEVLQSPLSCMLCRNCLRQPGNKPRATCWLAPEEHGKQTGAHSIYRAPLPITPCKTTSKNWRSWRKRHSNPFTERGKNQYEQSGTARNRAA